MWSALYKNNIKVYNSVYSVVLHVKYFRFDCTFPDQKMLP